MRSGGARRFALVGGPDSVVVAGDSNGLGEEAQGAGGRAAFYTACDSVFVLDGLI
jgi:hypothetical protein